MTLDCIDDRIHFEQLPTCCVQLSAIHLVIILRRAEAQTQKIEDENNRQLNQNSEMKAICSVTIFKLNCTKGVVFHSNYNI